MVKYRIKHDREGCVGCGACAATCPKFWEMDKKQPKSNLKAAEEAENSFSLDIDEKDFEVNMQAAEGCPVNVIHISEIGSGKELI